MKKILLLTVAVLAGSLIADSASAVPRLQTYITGSDYYANYALEDEDSWISTSANFELKVVGYWETLPEVTPSIDLVTSPPAYDYMDVFVVINTPTGQSGTVWINGIEINTFYNYGDPGLAAAAPDWYVKTMLPSIKNFNFYDAGRINNSMAKAWHYEEGWIHEPGWGDEVLLDIVVSGFDYVNFDAIGMDSNGKCYVSPNSHDSSCFAVPEPGTLSLLGLGLLGITPLLRKKKKT
ncbi:MAG: choice-of-anchor N protein [Candidatus Krumholzibacteriota bacterium]|nr:choice-of-anchor N protein [Candidatus Krumholzibacteriota bacterium]